MLNSTIANIRSTVGFGNTSMMLKEILMIELGRLVLITRGIHLSDRPWQQRRTTSSWNQACILKIANNLGCLGLSVGKNPSKLVSLWLRKNI